MCNAKKLLLNHAPLLSLVGDEFDIIANFHLSAHSDFQLGYCYFLSGNFVQNTGARGDTASLFYAMYNFRW